MVTPGAIENQKASNPHCGSGNQETRVASQRKKTWGVTQDLGVGGNLHRESWEPVKGMNLFVCLQVEAMNASHLPRPSDFFAAMQEHVSMF